MSTDKKSLSISIGDDEEFTKKTAADIIWRSRIEHLSNLMAIAESKATYMKIHGASKKVKKLAQREIVILSLVFLKMIEVVKGDCFNDGFRKIVKNGAPYFRKNLDSDDLNLREIFMFALIGEVNEYSNCGVPPNILENVTEACGHFYQTFHQNEWIEAEKHMRAIWVPYRGLQDKAKGTR